MQDLLQSILLVLGAIFFIFFLAEAFSGNKGAVETASKAVEETKNSLPVFLIICVICAVLLLSGTIAR